MNIKMYIKFEYLLTDFSELLPVPVLKFILQSESVAKARNFLVRNRSATKNSQTFKSCSSHN